MITTVFTAEMPKQYREQKGSKPRGVAGRNAGLKWIIDNTNSDDEGVIYFADDDNTYDLRLFDEVIQKKSILRFDYFMF